MPRRFSKLLSLIRLLGDVVGMNLAFVCSFLFLSNVINSLYLEEVTDLWVFANFTLFILYAIYKPYKTGRAERIGETLQMHLSIAFIHFLFNGCFALFKNETTYSWDFLILISVVTFFIIAFWETSYIIVLRKYRKKGYNYRNVVIMGYGELSEELKKMFITHPEYGYRFLGSFDNHRTGNGVLGKMDDLKSFVMENKVDEIYCCLPYVRYSKVKELVDFGEDNLIKVKLLADFRGFSLKGLEIERYDRIPVLNITRLPLDCANNQTLKRAFDIAFASLVIVGIFSWLYPIIALCIKLESPGPVLFKQKRSGLKNNTFWCYKFRSMRVNTDSDMLQATKRDSRITRVGAFLRKTSLDELPQFINVLRGNMSVVGPRPHMLSHTEEYSKQIDKFMARHFVKPGITGLAQAKGFRGETENIGMMKDRIRMDRFYVKNWTLIFDIRIIILTVQSMLKGQEKAY